MPGSRIGPVGTTGYSTGNHAHFDIWVTEKPNTTNKHLYNEKNGRYYLHPTYFNRKYLKGSGR
jgi:murein DD-endopeptidase MepM/ murein hydrolase activator NlpD